MDEGDITDEDDDHDDQQEGGFPRQEDATLDSRDKYQKISDKLANAINDVWTSEDEDDDTGRVTGTMSRWEKLSPEEKLKKKKIWEHRENTLSHFEIPPYSTPPRNAELDI